MKFLTIGGIKNVTTTTSSSGKSTKVIESVKELSLLDNTKLKLVLTNDKTFICSLEPLLDLNKITINEIITDQDAVNKQVNTIKTNQNEIKESIKTTTNDQDTIKTNQNEIKESIKTITNDQDTIKTKQNEIKESIKTITNDQDTIKTKQNEIKESIKTITNDQDTIKTKQNEIKESIKTITNDQDTIKTKQKFCYTFYSSKSHLIKYNYLFYNSIYGVTRVPILDNVKIKKLFFYVSDKNSLFSFTAGYHKGKSFTPLLDFSDSDQVNNHSYIELKRSSNSVIPQGSMFCIKLNSDKRNFKVNRVSVFCEFHRV